MLPYNDCVSLTLPLGDADHEVVAVIIFSMLPHVGEFIVCNPFSIAVNKHLPEHVPEEGMMGR